ncbi:MAG: nitric oxide reductase transcriptional regulator NorR [Porticoccaceae bacterium]|nr:nitric oxide reductase transcriptional regulator NorR [Porticoccaceae bacterium]
MSESWRLDERYLTNNSADNIAMKASSTVTEVVLDTITDLSQEMPSLERYARLLSGVCRAFPCDAAALLQLQGSELVPLAVIGLSDDTMGRRFSLDHEPRLAKIMFSREPVRFSADSQLNDPYDGLIETPDGDLDVHDCLGVSLYLDDAPWGALTLDALRPGIFDTIDPVELRAFIRLTEASIKVSNLIGILQDRAEHGHQVVQAVLGEQAQHEMIGQSRALQLMREEIEVVAQSDLGVLITGETGVGKELVARHLHRRSRRADYPLVYINCAALPENLVESELFGHAKGAFSGASEARAGKFELANGGSLFLDEIGEMPLAMQPKLLRVLQSGDVQRVGSDAHHQVDVRIIAATNRDLSREVAAGRFRADLYHRLSVYPIKVPALRERGQDVLLLAGHFLERCRRRYGLRGVRLDESARQALLTYDWPGNVRELEHLISRAVLRASASLQKDEESGKVLSINAALLELPGSVPRVDGNSAAAVCANPSPVTQYDNLREATEAFQRQLILQTLSRHDGNRASSARELGVDRGNFSRLLKRLEIA